jgi:hypothetical protein
VAYRDKSDAVMVSDGRRVYTIGERGDLHAPAIAAGRDQVYVVWPRNDGGIFHLFGSVWSKGQWSSQQRVTNEKGNDVWPRMAGDGKGNIALVWQGFRAGRSAILLKLWNGRNWSKEQTVSEGEGNCWMPAVAYGGSQLWLAWDSYATGAYPDLCAPLEAAGPTDHARRRVFGEAFDSGHSRWTAGGRLGGIGCALGQGFRLSDGPARHG